jgi:hypothetical protein
MQRRARPIRLERFSEARRRLSSIHQKHAPINWQRQGYRLHQQVTAESIPRENYNLENAHENTELSVGAFKKIHEVFFNDLKGLILL